MWLALMKLLGTMKHSTMIDGLVVDEQDAWLLERSSWVTNGRGYAVAKIKGKVVSLHRIILQPNDGEQVDHINGDKLNNRRSNLRACTTRQNSMNQKLVSRSTSGYKGVTWVKDRSRWRAQIMVMSKNKFLGYFDDKVEAAKAYDAAARLHFGEFARLNFEGGE